jgi:hypothetical protein
MCPIIQAIFSCCFTSQLEVIGCHVVILGNYGQSTKCRRDSVNIRAMLPDGGGCKVPSSDGIGPPSCAAFYAWSAACGCPLPVFVYTTGVYGSIELLLKLVQTIQHLYPIIQAGSQIMPGKRVS